MADYIERQAAIEIIQSMYPGMPRVPWLRKKWQERYEPYIRTEKAIRELPSADVVEVVRCKDCRYGHRYFDIIYDTTDSWVECRNPDGLNRDTSEDNFCSSGIRKE